MCKIQLTIAVNFFFSKDDNDEERAMHSKSDNIETMNNDKVDEVIKKVFIHLIKNIKLDWKNQ